MGSPKSQLALLAATAAGLCCAAPALSDETPPPVPPGTPSINQYVETVPTARGGAAADLGWTRARHLPRAVNSELRTRRGPVTKQLEAVANSSAYGAPRDKLPKPEKVSGNSTSSVEPKRVNPLSAAVSAVSDSSDSHIYWLLAAIIAVTTSMVWVATRRQAR